MLMSKFIVMSVQGPEGSSDFARFPATQKDIQDLVALMENAGKARKLFNEETLRLETTDYRVEFFNRPRYDEDEPDAKTQEGIDRMMDLLDEATNTCTPQLVSMPESINLDDMDTPGFNTNDDSMFFKGHPGGADGNVYAESGTIDLEWLKDVLKGLQ